LKIIYLTIKTTKKCGPTFDLIEFKNDSRLGCQRTLSFFYIKKFEFKFFLDLQMTYSYQSKLLYQQNQLPIFQNRMYENSEQARNCPTGDVLLVENQSTGLIFNQAFDPDVMLYDEHYQNEQSVSPLFLDHLNAVSIVLDRHLRNETIVEVGCGKGAFLELLLTKGFNITGFDPTYEGENPRIRKHYFSENSNIQAKGLILRHVLEHIQDPYQFLLKLSAANSYQGLIYIEVPCFDWICKKSAWFDIFYEHVNYFRVSDFFRMFGSVIDSGHLFGGQYLYVLGDLSTLKPPVFKENNAAEFPINLRPTFAHESTAIGSDVVIWGGASKGVIFALLSARAGRPVKAVIDINPAKQGKYLAGTGLLVQSPQSVLPSLKPGTTIYVMNSNYLAEIQHMSGNNFNCICID
jgi:SAM-dependent methyltransferase